MNRQHLKLRFMDSQKLRIVNIYDVFLFFRYLLFVQRSFPYLNRVFSLEYEEEKKNIYNSSGK